jgi:hypothetical protein
MIKVAALYDKKPSGNDPEGIQNPFIPSERTGLKL